jgi:hypothetical protein
MNKLTIACWVAGLRMLMFLMHLTFDIYTQLLKEPAQTWVAYKNQMLATEVLADTTIRALGKESNRV